MALTFREVPQTRNESGQIRERFYDITFDSSYPTGGETIAAKNVGLLSIYGAEPVGGNAAAGAYRFHWDTANNKMMVFVTGAASVTGNVTVVGGGIGEAIGINPDTNAGVLSKAAATNRTIPIATFLGAAPSVAAAAEAELDNGSSLSTVTGRFRFIGI